MAGYGFRHEDIARRLEITPKTLRKHFREELDCGAIEANTEVMKTLFGMATSGTNITATIFWAKTRCGLKERAIEAEQLAAEPPQFVEDGE